MYTKSYNVYYYNLNRLQDKTGYSFCCLVCWSQSTAEWHLLLHSKGCGVYLFCMWMYVMVMFNEDLLLSARLTLSEIFLSLFNVNVKCASSWRGPWSAVFFYLDIWELLCIHYLSFMWCGCMGRRSLVIFRLGRWVALFIWLTL